MLRNWSRNKMTLRTRNCWERLSNTVGLYRYSQASFLSANVFVFCFFTLLAGHRERSVCFHTVAKAASALLKGQICVWLRGWYTAPEPIERKACLIGHFSLNVSMTFHQSHSFRHFTKLIWPKGPLFWEAAESSPFLDVIWGVMGGAGKSNHTITLPITASLHPLDPLDRWNWTKAASEITQSLERILILNK